MNSDYRATPWDGVLDGTVGSCLPIQCKELLKDIEGFMAIPCEFEESFEDFNEDCLYLDLYTSNLEKDANRPVSYLFVISDSIKTISSFK